MGRQETDMREKHLTLGLLAHVDAGKTTLAESILYETGRIRKAGRVDHGDAYLDNYRLEQSRGITIFSKQAEVSVGELAVTLLDTPGHVDFSAEMERTLQVLDYAVLVINGADGVQGHTETLWRLLAGYRIPVFLFVNKMDQEGTDRERLLGELRARLSEDCIPFPDWPGDFCAEELESIALSEERVTEEYLETGTIREQTIRRLIRERRIFPCYFGSALRQQGIRELLEGVGAYAEPAVYPEAFGARVYKVSRDPAGERLVHMKITGGSLKVKDLLTERRPGGEAGEAELREKVNQIRIYSGEKYETVREAAAGTICAVTGLSAAGPGTALGAEQEAKPPVLEPVLSYRVLFPEEVDAHVMLGKLRQLEEEDPLLRVLWQEELGEIHVQLMGEIQTEILKSLILERFGIQVSFDAGNIVYKETIQNTVEGVGHYEPLRHYAEVHLLMEPGEPGSGLVFDTDCCEDELDRNWQRLILTHLAERPHRGVLTGSQITDMRITLAAGRAHLKHTEGGDFRQAVYRAVRQGLMQAENVLLEPFYAFTLEIPTEYAGRAMHDIQRMHGVFDAPETDGQLTVLTGSGPVSEMRDYQMEVTAYTRGRGRLFCGLKGYEPCHEQEKVLEAIGYQPEADAENPCGSVFCAHGAGYFVPWDQVFDHMHIESQLKKRQEKARQEQERLEREAAEAAVAGNPGRAGTPAGMTGRAPAVSQNSAREDRELEEIFIRTYGRVERRYPAGGAVTVSAGKETRRKKDEDAGQEYLLVDGYNIIFAWDNLKDLAGDDIGAARSKLMDILCNYQGFKKCTLILVFDAYKVEGETPEIQRYHNIHVVYTKEAETADQYIEKVVHEIGRKYHVTVATSDGVEQVITTGQGAKLISAREFLEEVRIVNRQILEEWEKHRQSSRNYLFDYLDPELARQMEQVRLGEDRTDTV